jgi:L-ascorbate metabolism protein UlaG (beta-lactamase superfamily)
VTTDIRGGMFGRQADANSIFVFEVGDLCIGHLGHLHHELSPGHRRLIGRLDVVMVPVDGGYTMAQVNMVNVLKELRAQVVLPMHYFTLANLNRFAANIGTEFKVERRFSREVVLSQELLPKVPSVYILTE